jgi:Family of unknown function (DUF6412)
MAVLVSELFRLAGQVLFAPAGHGGPALALAITVLAGAVAVCLVSSALAGRASAALPLVRRASALREKSWRAAFMRQRDPDAAGRPRPRAPSADPAAAAS